MLRVVVLVLALVLIWNAWENFTDTRVREVPSAPVAREDILERYPPVLPTRPVWQTQIGPPTMMVLCNQITTFATSAAIAMPAGRCP